MPHVAGAAVPNRTAAALRPVMAGSLLATALAALDQNIVNTALPRMMVDLGGLAHLSWVVTAFMLTATIATPLYGKLSDVHGRRAMFFVAIPVFVGGSLLCALAHSMAQMVAFRALQGLGAGGLLVLAQAAVGDVVPPRDRPRYQGLFTGVFAVASVAGPLLGGFITVALSWRWVFYVNLPIGALALALIAAGLRGLPGRSNRPTDFAGAALLTAATAPLLLLLSWGGTEFAWASLPSAALCASTLAFAALFVWRETHAADPLVRLALFADRVFARGVGVSGMMAFAMLGSTVFLPLYFQFVHGMNPAAAGAMMLPMVAGMMFTSIIGGRMVARRGRNRPFLLSGIGLEVTALCSLALFAAIAAPPALFLVSTGVLGLGLGMGMPNLTTTVQNAVAQSELGAAMGTMTFTRSLGGALGVATSGAITAASLAGAIADGTLSRGALTGDLHLAAALDPHALAAVGAAYRVALTGCFTVSGTVMATAFVLVLGLPDLALRGGLEPAEAATGRS